MLLGGVLVKPGEVLPMAGPLRAHECVASGRCEFVNPADSERVRAAVAADRDRLIGTLEGAQRQRNAVGWLAS